MGTTWTNPQAKASSGQIFQTGVFWFGLQRTATPPQVVVRAVHSQAYKFMLARLRQARKEADLTQVEVARALRRTQAFVSKCELGERRIDPLDLQAFAALYRKPFEYFLPERTMRR